MRETYRNAPFSQWAAQVPVASSLCDNAGSVLTHTQSRDEKQRSVQQRFPGKLVLRATTLATHPIAVREGLTIRYSSCQSWVNKLVHPAPLPQFQLEMVSKILLLLLYCQLAPYRKNNTTGGISQPCLLACTTRMNDSKFNVRKTNRITMC